MSPAFPLVNRTEIARLKQAWQDWSDASGVAAKMVGRESLDSDPGTNGLRRPDGSPRPDRHVSIAFKAQRQVPIMVRGVIGLAKPAVVLLPSREIIAGVAVFRRIYFLEERKVDPDRVMHLYLHELGHVMGLGHAGREDNVMYPSLGHLVELGTGDRAGVDDYTQTCACLPGRAAVVGGAGVITGWWE